MFDRFSKFAGRKTVLATTAVLALTAVAPTASYAGGRHWHGGGGGAAAAAAFVGIVGTGLAIAATRDAYAYDTPAYYGGGPVYYDNGPTYYGGDSYYGPRPFHRCGGPYQSAQGGQGSIGSCY
ncbi:hypothetical protein [Bradyrhizobium sp. OK095]|uniref:hypothetical protein n=1 Tax=Bradyrhizobium sp. OK095 TaxID=1882760 RepID=UPI0008CC2DDB|nr:hypothetical protein [Bradyrhizobium sp. OK095]SEM91364.1 hypothetical protein SAMN05443254_104435 [Bradyrhizobium sp. OK095]